MYIHQYLLVSLGYFSAHQGLREHVPRPYLLVRNLCLPDVLLVWFFLDHIFLCFFNFSLAVRIFLSFL